jgi:hypothetical protein
LTPSEKASPDTDKTPEGTATCASLNVCWNLQPQMLVVCDNRVSQARDSAFERELYFVDGRRAVIGMKP